MALSRSRRRSSLAVQRRSPKGIQCSTSGTKERLALTTPAGHLVEKATQEKQQADDIRHSTEDIVRETQTTARRATMFDGAEVFVEIAMVLCSVSLLTGASVFWRVSFVSTGLGLMLAALGFLRH